MTYEIEQKLSEIFPWLDATQFDCNDGWQWIIVAMLKEIDDYYFDLGQECSAEIMQSKEKWGYLNTYLWNSGDEELDKTLEKIITKYSLESMATCEICGAEGKLLRDEYWITVRCEDCRI